MNKKRKAANKKHQKTRARVKALNALSLKKMKKKKPAVVKEVVENVAEAVKQDTTAKKETAKKAPAKKATAKKKAPAKKAPAKKTATKK